MFLHTPGNVEPPWEFIRYKIRMMYGIDPKRLREMSGQDLIEIFQDIKCSHWENKIRNLHGK